MILIIRASHANQYELQNYEGIAGEAGIKVITSHHPLTSINLPSIQLWSPTDLPNFPFRRQICNRLIGGEQWLLGLEKLIEQQKKFDGSNHRTILHTAETYTPYTHQAVKLRKASKIAKLVCTCWETIPHANEKFGKLKHWKSEAYQYVDTFHTPTRRAKQALISEGVNPKKIRIIPYGVDLSLFYQAKNNPSTASRKPVILMVARPTLEKGIEIFRKLASELSEIADFQLVSLSPYKDMPAIYSRADIFFLPSQKTATWEEQYGMVLVEAMASGLPIVSTNSGAIPEVIGKSSILCDPKDIVGMKETLIQLIQNKKLRAIYSARVLARARSHFDSKKVATKLLNLCYTNNTNQER